MRKTEIVIKGGGDLASGTAHRLYICGFRPVITELEKPRMVRRTVSFANAVYEETTTVENVRAKKISHIEDIPKNRDFIPVLTNPYTDILQAIKPAIVIDARMLKKESASSVTEAKLVIGLGPGFQIGVSAHRIIETNRGIHLGRVFYEGSAAQDTGIPGFIEGKSKERVLRSPADGRLEPLAQIGDLVYSGQELAQVGEKKIFSPFNGVIRGMLADGLEVHEGEKVGDIDPRTDVDCNTISDKARAIGGGVLEAIFSYFSWHIE